MLFKWCFWVDKKFFKKIEKMKILVGKGQSLTDIAIMVYGSADAVVVLAGDNGMSVTDHPVAGTGLDYYADNVIDPHVVDFYANNNILPVTDFAIDINNRSFDETFDQTFN